METEGTLSFNDRTEWRLWLEKHHDTETEGWLLLYKKHTGKAGLQLSEAVEEAICFGWIDGKLKRVDDKRYMLRFTPRRPGSVWSKINKERAERMMEEGKMTAAGQEKVEAAKRSGRWDSAYTSKEKPTLPQDLREALVGNSEAWKNFNQFSNSQQFMYVYWVLDAKRESTRKRRIQQVVERS